MKTLKFIATGLFVLGTTFLVAETLPNNGPLPFGTYDKDNNNVITAKEFAAIKTQRMTQNAQNARLMKNAGNSARFSEIDKNGDGIVTQKELKVHQKARFNKRFNQRNTNKKMKNGMGKRILNQGQNQ